MGGKASAAGPEPGQFAKINKRHVTRSRFPRLELKPWAAPRTLALLPRPSGMKVSGKIDPLQPWRSYWFHRGLPCLKRVGVAAGRKDRLWSGRDVGARGGTAEALARTSSEV